MNIDQRAVRIQSPGRAMMALGSRCAEIAQVLHASRVSALN